MPSESNSHHKWISIQLLAICLLSMLFSNIAFGFTLSEFEKQFTVDHGGSLELVYLGFKDRQPPLAPLHTVRANHRYFYTLPDVITPSMHSIFVLENIRVKPGEEVLDMGSGTGILSVFAADTAKRVVASDLSYSARENTQMNARLHAVDNIVDARQGDLFSSIESGETFDVIFLSVDYPRVKNGEGLWELHNRFFKEVGAYLRNTGRIYYTFGYYENLPRLIPMIVDNGYQVMELNNYKSIKYNKEPMVLMLQKRTDTQ